MTPNPNPTPPANPHDPGPTAIRRRTPDSHDATPTHPLPATAAIPPDPPFGPHGEGRACTAHRSEGADRADFANSANPNRPADRADLANPANSSRTAGWADLGHPANSSRTAGRTDFSKPADPNYAADRADSADTADPGPPAERAGSDRPDGAVVLADLSGAVDMVEPCGPVDSVAPGDLPSPIYLHDSDLPAMLGNSGDLTRPGDCAGVLASSVPDGGTCQVVRIDEDDVRRDRRDRREIREYLARRARVLGAAEGLCICRGADRAPHLLLVEDPLDLARREARARLGSILGHCRCEPGAVAA